MISYLLLELRYICPSTFVYDYEMNTAGVSSRNSHLTGGNDNTDLKIEVWSIYCKRLRFFGQRFYVTRLPIFGT